MRNLLSSIVLVLVLVGATATSALAITLDYSNAGGAKVEFTGTGDTFSFINNGSGNGFTITSPGAALGLFGNISGTFTIGTITTTGPLQSALVSGSGTFLIDDGPTDFSGSLTWVDINTVGGGGSLNAFGNVNLTGITYGGSNSALIALSSASTGVVSSSFQFVPAKTLTELTSDGAVNGTSYSGNIAVPEPSSLLLLGAGLLGLAAYGRKKLMKG